MILFANDWLRYPRAIVDYNTKNKSFVRLASIYRTMGIKNHAFLLALHNPELQNVDPHDPNLSFEQIAMVAEECKDNPWYVLREVLRAPGIAGGEPSPVEANRGIISLWWCFFCHVMIILIQPRQTGKSFGTDGLMATLMNIICKKTDINLLTKDDDLRRKNIQRIKDIINDLPYYLRQMGRSDVNNGEMITVRSRENTYNTHVPQASKKAALNQGRGLTSPIFHVDEPPFQRNIKTSLPAALASTGAAVDKAIANNAPYGTILTTTAGKRDDVDGSYIYKLLMESAEWNERFFDAVDQEQLEQIVRKASKDGKFRVAAVFNHRQLGKTDEWLAMKLEAALQEGEDADRDYFNIWTAGNEISPLTKEVSEMISASVVEPSYIEISPIYSYTTNWYETEYNIENRMRTGTFILGSDTSDAAGRDDISFYLLDLETLETVATATINETNLITFAEWLTKFIIRYENVTTIIERRSSGVMIIDYLLLMLPMHGIDPFKRLFNWVVNDADEDPERFRDINKPMNRRERDLTVRFKRDFGFATSGSGAQSRSELYSSVFQQATKRAGSKIKAKILVDQILGLIIKNGRIDHGEGGHDDMVIGFLLAHWLMMHGKNLNFYGIDPRRIMSRAVIKNYQNINKKEAFQQHEQLQIRNRITALSEKLIEATDEFLIMRYESELNALSKRLILEPEEHYSFDELISFTKDERKKRRGRKGYGY